MFSLSSMFSNMITENWVGMLTLKTNNLFIVFKRKENETMIFMQCGLTQHLIIILLVTQWLSHNAIYVPKTVLIPLEDAAFKQTHQYAALVFSWPTFAPNFLIIKLQRTIFLRIILISLQIFVMNRLFKCKRGEESKNVIFSRNKNEIRFLWPLPFVICHLPFAIWISSKMCTFGFYKSFLV